MVMNVQIFLLLCFVNIAMISCAPKKYNITCDEQIILSDRCVRSGLLMGLEKGSVLEFDGNVMPKTEADVDKHCKRIYKDFRCISKYGRCLSLFPRSVFNLGARNIKKVLDGICGNQAGKQEFLRHTTCFKDENWVDFQHIFEELTTIIDYVAANVTQGEIIPYACCTYAVVLNEAGRKKIEDGCPINGVAIAEFFVGLVKAMFFDAIDIACGRYSNAASCHQHLPGGMKAIFSLIYPPEIVKRKDHTAMISLLEIARRLDNDLDGLNKKVIQ